MKAAFGYAIVAALAMATIACSSSSTETSDVGAATSSTVKTSTVNDWIRAVCVDGNYYDGDGGLERSNGSAMCLTAPDRNGNPQIVFGSYSSSSGLEYDISIRPGVPYAKFENDRGETWVFFLLGGTERTPTRLEPLEDFGFRIFQNAD